MPTGSEVNGNAVFASTQYWMETGVGGYMGTQVWRLKNGTETHKAIFSMWDASKTIATAGIGDGCGRFGGEGVGSHCLITYHLEPGHRYSVAVALESTNSSGAVWKGTITDVATSTSTTIGRLYFPNFKGEKGYGLFQVNAAAFQEYFLSGSNCEGQAQSSIGLIGPYFHAGKVQPTMATPDYAGGSPPCKYVNVDGSVKGFGTGRPYVTLEAGGNTIKKNQAGAKLWST